MKAIIAAAAAAPLMAAPAFAGPYVSIESNSGFTGTDYDGSLLETHFGVEGDLGDNAGWYVQAGPAIVLPDGGDSTTELSGKVGVGADLTERLNVYGEVAAITTEEINFDEDLNVGVKLGLKYSF